MKICIILSKQLALIIQTLSLFKNIQRLLKRDLEMRLKFKKLLSTSIYKICFSSIKSIDPIENFIQKVNFASNLIDFLIKSKNLSWMFLFISLYNKLVNLIFDYALLVVCMNRSTNVVESHQNSQSQSSLSESQNLGQRNVIQFSLPLKKKRIVRKKYKPRKKDVFIHTICILNKNNFRPQNSIIETFLIKGFDMNAEQSGKSVQASVDQKDEQYVKKLVENIRFTQNLDLNSTIRVNSVENQVKFEASITMRNQSTEEELEQKWGDRNQSSYFSSYMPQYMSLMNGMSLIG